MGPRRCSERERCASDLPAASGRCTAVGPWQGIHRTGPGDDRHCSDINFGIRRSRHVTCLVAPNVRAEQLAVRVDPDAWSRRVSRRDSRCAVLNMVLTKERRTLTTVTADATCFYEMR